MVAEMIEKTIQQKVREILTDSKQVELPEDIIETDNLGEVIEKLAILHCRMWYLEDAISENIMNDAKVAELKRKIDICFKDKRPMYVQAINKMVEKSIVQGKSLVSDSVKLYKGYQK